MQNSKEEKIRDNLKNFYENCAEPFSSTRGYWWHDLNFIKEYVKSKQKVLDFGCGNGRLFDFLNKEIADGVDYTGVDISSKLTEIAKEKYPQAKFELIEREGQLSFEKESFDAVLAIAVFHHFTPRMAQQALQEIKRTLKPGGTLIITAWRLWDTKFNKFLWQGFLKGNFSLGRNITFEANEKKFQRFCYWWTKKSLEKVLLQSGFSIKKSGFTFDQKGKKRNLYFVAEKS